MAVTPTTESRAEVVADLRYGVALYHFFQQSYFDAISEIMVAEHQQALPNHQRNAELLKGGMSLSYGMGSQAQTIFEQFLNEPADDNWGEQQRARHDQQKRRAWFYLSKLYYQRGDSEKTLAALSQMGPLNTELTDPSHDPVTEQSLYMKSRLALHNGDMETAQQLNNALSEQSPYKPYGYFNQGAYFSAEQQWQAAIESYQGLVTYIDTMPLLDEEAKLLRDKALTAAGYSLLNHGLPARAIEQFQRVRRDSPLVNQALLGFGWAELKRENYRSALSPWQHLKKQSLLLPAVQEVYLAIPYAYEQLNESSAALLAYQQGAKQYQQEIDMIGQAINHYQQEQLASLFAWPESSNDDWLVVDEVVPATQSAPYLAQLLSRNKFQGLLKDYRALLTLRTQLSTASSRSNVLAFVDQEQQLLWKSVIEGDRYSQIQQRYQTLLERKKQLDKRLKKAVDDDSGLQLLDANSKDLLKRVERQRQALPKLIAAGEANEIQTQWLDRYYGLLVWRAAESVIDKRWQLKRKIVGLDRQLTDIKVSLSSLEKLISSRSDSGFAPRIGELDIRIEQQQRIVNQKIKQQDKLIREEAIEVLGQQQQLLGHYLAQAKLSVARLYDVASMDNL